MKIELAKKPNKPIIIEGFPGFGLVGTIAAEYLLDHLEVESIGRIVSHKLQPFIAVHEGKVVEPLGIFYNKKHNLVIQHAVTNVKGYEWELADAVVHLAKQLKARELISLEGIGTLGGMGTRAGSGAFFYTNNSASRKKFQDMQLAPLAEGIIVGVTGCLLIRASSLNLSALFAETRPGIPDSRAAAALIEILDRYLGLKIPTQPLIKKAEEFEEKLQDMFEKVKETSKEEEKKGVGYIA